MLIHRDAAGIQRITGIASTLDDKAAAAAEPTGRDRMKALVLQKIDVDRAARTGANGAFDGGHLRVPRCDNRGDDLTKQLA